jgi:hypothetical protein
VVTGKQLQLRQKVVGCKTGPKRRGRARCLTVPAVFCSQKLVLESLQTLNTNTVVLRSLVRYL